MIYLSSKDPGVSIPLATELIPLGVANLLNKRDRIRYKEFNKANTVTHQFMLLTSIP